MGRLRRRLRCARAPLAPGQSSDETLQAPTRRSARGRRSSVIPRTPALCVRGTSGGSQTSRSAPRLVDAFHCPHPSPAPSRDGRGSPPSRPPRGSEESPTRGSLAPTPGGGWPLGAIPSFPPTSGDRNVRNPDPAGRRSPRRFPQARIRDGRRRTTRQGNFRRHQQHRSRQRHAAPRKGDLDPLGRLGRSRRGARPAPDARLTHQRHRTDVLVPLRGARERPCRLRVRLRRRDGRLPRQQGGGPSPPGPGFRAAASLRACLGLRDARLEGEPSQVEANLGFASDLPSPPGPWMARRA